MLLIILYFECYKNWLLKYVELNLKAVKAKIRKIVGKTKEIQIFKTLPCMDEYIVIKIMSLIHLVRKYLVKAKACLKLLIQPQVSWI